MQVKYARVRDLTEVDALFARHGSTVSVDHLISPDIDPSTGHYYVILYPSPLLGAATRFFIRDGSRSSELYGYSQIIMQLHDSKSICDRISITKSDYFSDWATNITHVIDSRSPLGGYSPDTTFAVFLNALRIKTRGVIPHTTTTNDPTFIVIDLRKPEYEVFLFSVMTWFNGGGENHPVPVMVKDNQDLYKLKSSGWVHSVQSEFPDDDLLLVFRSGENPFDSNTQPFAVCYGKHCGATMYVTNVLFRDTQATRKDARSLLENLDSNRQTIKIVYDKSLWQDDSWTTVAAK